MQIISKPEQIVKFLSAILIILFLIAMAYTWVQSGRYHFDTNQAHLHMDMQNHTSLY
ncbi:MAG: hypothetical protein QM479_17410 [Pseudomonadota bacterium]